MLFEAGITTASHRWWQDIAPPYYIIGAFPGTGRRGAFWDFPQAMPYCLQTDCAHLPNRVCPLFLFLNVILFILLLSSFFLSPPHHICVLSLTVESGLSVHRICVVPPSLSCMCSFCTFLPALKRLLTSPDVRDHLFSSAEIMEMIPAFYLRAVCHVNSLRASTMTA